MRLAAKIDASPLVLGDLYLDFSHLWIVSGEMIDQLLRELLDLFDGVELGQSVHGVLDGVRRQNAAVVASSVAALEFAFQLDADRKLFEVMPVLLALHFDQADMRSAIVV